MKVILSIGHINVYFFGLMIAIGALVGILLAAREANRKGLPGNKILDLAIYTFLGGIVGARLIYIIAYDPLYYMNNPLKMLMLQQGGLSIHGGILGGALVAIYYIRRQKLPLWKIADVLAPSLILGQAIGRVGCDVFGIATKSFYPWGVWVDGILLHPVQIYESTLNYLLFLYLWHKKDRITYHGQVFTHYLIGYAFIRGLVEFLRINPVVAGSFTVAHLMSAITILIGLALSFILKEKYPAPPVRRVRPDYGMFIAIAISMIFSVFLFYSVQA